MGQEQERPVSEIKDDLILEMRKLLKAETEVHILMAELLNAITRTE